MESLAIKPPHDINEMRDQLLELFASVRKGDQKEYARALNAAKIAATVLATVSVQMRLAFITSLVGTTNTAPLGTNAQVQGLVIVPGPATNVTVKGLLSSTTYFLTVCSTNQDL